MSRTPIQGASDTARWVAYFRALESERPDALFHDSYAGRLAGDRGRAIAEQLPKGPLSWSLAVRTRVFDELIVDAINRSGVRAVLNLAAGLDARPYRLSLPAELRWIEVDLPDIIAWKNEVLGAERPACIVERVSLDLALRRERKDLFERVSAQGAPVLVVTEGLLAYLDEAQVASLASDLLQFCPKGRWLLENVAPVVLARMQRMWNRKLRSANAEMKFAPTAGLSFFRAQGWRPQTIRSLLDEAQRLGREMRAISYIRFWSSLIPPLRNAYARRQEKFREAVVYALMECSSVDSDSVGASDSGQRTAPEHARPSQAGEQRGR